MDSHHTGSAREDAGMNWTIERPMLPGFYWFKRSVSLTSAAREVVLATVVGVTGFAPNVKIWFPQKDMPITISACEGRWSGPLDVPSG